MLAGEKEGRTTAATTYQAWEVEGELPLPHGDGDGCSVLQADRMGESRTLGGIAVVSTVWREGFGLGQLARWLGKDETSVGGSLRTARMGRLRLCAASGTLVEVWAGLQHKAVAVTTTTGKQTEKPLGMLGRAGKAKADRHTGSTGTGTDRRWHGQGE